MGENGHPRVSLGLPVYNGGRYVRGAIQALLSQSFSDFELIICDNASADESETICREMAARDGRVRYVRNETNIGAAPNFNKTFELARGEYFKWVAHDDLHGVDYLKRAVEVLDAEPRVSLVHSRVGIIDAQGEAVTSVVGTHGEQLRDPPRRMGDRNLSVRLNELLLNTRWCFEIFGLMRREQLARTPLHGTFYGSDKVLLTYLCLAGRFHEIPEELFFRRYHANSSTGISTARAREAWIGGGKKGVAIPQIKCFKGYAGAIGASSISLGDKVACYGVLGRYALQLRKWRAMFAGDAAVAGVGKC
ncbi:MAG TPA: glycosyltransferase family A protein [Tepidisphaeraceae bacterium]|jgi:glycosyltransferase involved in cell wall biosynthesis|nr:glycosyltransferase family A protein [Tepidisphaeraceae bacterium]